MLSRALKGSVDSMFDSLQCSSSNFNFSTAEHYQAFAASLPHHSTLLTHLSAAQTEISGARASLLEAKESLGGKRADLVQLWSRGQMLEEMIKILDQMHVPLSLTIRNWLISVIQ